MSNEFEKDFEKIVEPENDNLTIKEAKYYQTFRCG